MHCAIVHCIAIAFEAICHQLQSYMQNTESEELRLNFFFASSFDLIEWGERLCASHTQSQEVNLSQFFK